MSSAIPGFFKLSVGERQQKVKEMYDLSDEELGIISKSAFSLTLDKADTMIENCVAMHSTPIGVATNFIVDGKEILIPMANEEPSVIAGASNAAKLARGGGGFTTSTGSNMCRGQVILIPPPTEEDPIEKILSIKDEIIEHSNASMPAMVERTGGTKDVTCRAVKTSSHTMIVTELHIDVGDAMGANCVNNACECVQKFLSERFNYIPLMGIISNLASERLVYATARWPIKGLAGAKFDGYSVAKRIVMAADFAAADTARASTHRKGIMNGVTAVVLATGNDTRAVEAAVHSYASVSENQALTEYNIDGDFLVGKITLPLPVGVVGGSMKRDPANPIIRKILDVHTANDLARIIAAVGLASNFAAIRALVTSGINAGHMKLHARNIAHETGAVGDEIDQVVKELNNGEAVTVTRAHEILKRIRENK